MNQGASRKRDTDPLAFLAGGGEMGERTRAFDWSKTPVEPVDGWQHSLRTAVSICLGSRYPIVMWWGNPDYTMFYNDAYIPVLGVTKHPGWLGRSGRECWSELWPIIGPMLEGVFATGEATWSEDLLLVLHRNLTREEAYFTFSYSPIRDDMGKLSGIFCACTETTGRVIGERRLRTLRDLGRTVAEAKEAVHACAVAARTLVVNPADIPFALIYLLDADARQARLAAVSGLKAGAASAPDRIDLGAATEGSAPWPLRRVFETAAAELVPDLTARFGALPGGPWPEPSESALVLPIAAPGQSRPTGFLVTALSPRRVVDADYRSFLDLIAGHVGTAIANARAHEEERRRAEVLAELDRTKTAFFSNVSHEFRTPLTLMLGPVEDLLARPEGRLQPEDRESLAVVHRNALRLHKLVNTLLDFSRLEAGRAQANYQPTDLASLTAELASNFRSACAQAGLELFVDSPPLDGPVHVDPDMWEKIVLNLLSNAFKFTLEGRIEVSLRKLDGRAELSVRDTGTGIPADQMPRLFERFHRVEGVTGRTQEGSGIGLALVRELARLHGGEVRAVSKIGQGSTFTVSVPLGTAHLPEDRIGAPRTLTSTALGTAHFVEEALRWLPDSVSLSPAPVTLFSAPAHGQAPTTERPRILLADDNADMRDYVRRLLADRYAVTAVADGAAALDAARREPPDLVLTDLMMPGLDGFGLLRELRADERTRTLPVLLLSARAGEEARVEGLEAGADDYLTKPFSAKELLARIDGQIELARVRREAAARERRLLIEADRRKDEFLATLAHELRNPLAPLRNGLQVMKLARNDAEVVEQSRTMMERQLGQIVRLVDDLLDVSRISRGKIELRMERVELAKVVQQAVETSRPLIEASGHELTVNLPPQPTFVDADMVRLAQVFSNLLNNAAKYTDRGGHVTLTVVRQGSDAVVSVLDTGVGIPDHMLPKVFEMFTQVERSLEKSQGGLGIGLSLVKGLVEMHGGSVEARSAGHRRGSEFIVRLPVDLSGVHEVKPPAEEGEPACPLHCRILVADDNEDSATSLAMMLRIMGNEVRTASDGLQAVEVAAAFRPDVILLDIGMPKLNGYEACRRIHAQPWSKQTILIAVTGWGQEEDRRRSEEAGFNHHMVKPIDTVALEKLLTGLQVQVATNK